MSQAKCAISTFVDKNVYSFADWWGYSCADENLGYSAVEIQQLFDNCPRSCRVCTPYPFALFQMGPTIILPYSQYLTVNTEQAVNLGEDQLGLWRKQAAYTDRDPSSRLSKLDQDANELWSQQLRADQQRGIPLTVTHPHRVGGQVMCGYRSGQAQ